MKTTILCLIILVLTLFAGCKEAAITYPVPYDESDFNLPPGQYSSSTIALSVNRSNKVAYVGEEFEIKVSLYDMPESLFAASLDVTVPSNIRMERIIGNPEYIGSSSKTVGVQVVSPQTASFGISYRRTTVPKVTSSGVLFKIICKALATGDHANFATAKVSFRITRKNVPISPTSVNLNMAVASVGVDVTVSDEFAR